MKLFVFISIFVLIGQAYAALNDECFMPVTYEAGRCISIYNCKHFLQDVGNVTADVAYFMRKSRCGTGPGPHFDPLVCCGRVVTLLPEECGVSGFSQRIVGGNETSIDAYPWMALLNYKDSQGTEAFLCGGFLINARYVLTAAHCLRGSVLSAGWNLISVRLGEHDLRTNPDIGENEDDKNEPYVDIMIEKVIVHGEYGPRSKKYDIALLRLAQEVEISEFRHPICLPIHGERATPKNILFVAGWGLADLDPTNRRLLQLSDVKRHVNVTLFDTEECNRLYANTISSKQLCAGGEQGRDSCTGDSGGPLMNRRPRSDLFYAEAIVSFGPQKCGTKGHPGVYVRIAPFLDWILDNMTL